MTDSEGPQKQHEVDEATTTSLSSATSRACTEAPFVFWKDSHHDEQTITTTVSDTSKPEFTTTTTGNETDASYCSCGSTYIQTPVRRILELGIVPDCGTPPLWLNDTLSTTKANIFRKFPTTPLDDVEERTKTRVSLAKTECCEERTPRAKTSALAAAFIKKVDQSWKEDLVRLRQTKHVPSSRVVKSVKGRWPPQTNSKSTSANKSGGEAKAQPAPSAIEINTTISTKELLDAFENRNFRQTTDLSPKAIKEAAFNRAREETLFSPVSVKQRQRSFENNGTSPLHKLYHRSNRLCRSEHATVTSGHEGMTASTPLYDDKGEDPTPSSPPEESTELRASYKIQYLGKREWGSGYVDSTFPTMVQRLVDASDVSPGLVDTHDSSQCLLGKDTSDVVGGGNLTRCNRKHDRWFDDSAKVDLTARGIPMTDRRFDVNSSTDSSMPTVPHRTRDVYIPTIWQTRVLDSFDGNATGGKWRLKRVWEHCQNSSIVIEDGELDYYVDDFDLESTLHSLLGTYICFDTNRSVDVNSITTSSESNMSEVSHADLAKNRWGTSEGSKDPLLKKPWRVQRVWDKDGVICCVDDERTLDGASLLELFSTDDNTAKDILVGDGPEQGLLGPERDHQEDTTRSKDNQVMKESDSVAVDGYDSDTCSYFSKVSDDDGIAYVENDPLDEKDFEASLDEASTNSHDEGGDRNLKLIRRKLRKVEKWIQELQEEKGGKTNEAKLRLQRKCVQYLNTLSHQLKEIHREQRQILGGVAAVSASVQQGRRHKGIFSGNDEYIEGSQSQHDQHIDSATRQHRSADRDRCRKKKPLYHVQGETRKDCIKAIGAEGSALELNPRHTDERSQSHVISSDLSDCTSLQSMLGTLKNLDVIFEDEDAGASVKEDYSDLSLFHRKIRKVEKEMQKIVNKNGEEGKTRKLYLRLKEKLAQYKSEISGDTLLQNCSTHATGREWNGVRKRVEQAIGVMQMTLDEADEENWREETQFASKELYAMTNVERGPMTSLVKERLPPLACTNAGKWSSPFATGDDDLKVTMHSLESVYR
jgi:hypothetical protein